MGEENDLGRLKEAFSHNETILSYVIDISNKMDEFSKALNYPVVGLRPGLTKVSDQADDNTDRIRALELENKRLRCDIGIMKGIMQRMADQIDNMKAKIDDQKSRSMSTNVVIHNYPYSVPRGTSNLKPVVEEFLKDEMEMSFNSKEIFLAHKLGDNTIVAKVSYPLKEAMYAKSSGVFENKKNPTTKKPIYITDQQPESVRAKRREAWEMADVYKEKNEKLKKEGKPEVKIEVKKDKLFVNNQLIRNPVPPPKPADLIEAEPDDLKSMEYIKFSESKVCGEKGSTFRGVYTEVSDIPETRLAYRKIRMLNPSASHVMLAYAIKNGNNIEYGKQDDGEWGGAFKILEAHKENNCENVAVFVIRQFGGVQLGSKRFSYIKDASIGALKKAGLVT